jgi:PhnB protein
MTIASSEARPITVTPYLCVKGAASALDFYTRAFGAVETLRLPAPEGRIGHAEIRIGGPGGAPIFLADEFPEIGVLSPETLGGSPVTIHLTVPNADALFERAVAAGAMMLRPVADQGHGHRNGKLTDPFGHTWMLSSFSDEALRDGD